MVEIISFQQLINSKSDEMQLHYFLGTLSNYGEALSISRQRSTLVPGWGPVPEYQVETLYPGTKVGTGFLCAHRFCHLRAINSFVPPLLRSRFKMVTDKAIQAAFTLVARVRYLLGTNLNTPFFLESRKSRCQCANTRSRHCTQAQQWAPGPYVHNVVILGTVHFFVLAARLMFQNGVIQGKME